MGLAQAIDDFIADAGDDLASIQNLCEAHRQKRNIDSRQKLLQHEFHGIQADQVLANLISDPEYVDIRNNLCVWARPTQALIELVDFIQGELQMMAPGLWIAPASWLHMTVVEIVHSQPDDVVKQTVIQLLQCLSALVNLVLEHPVVLGRPQLNYDDATVTMTFVPIGEREYTYLHLRRDIANMCTEHGVEVGSRYFTTSSHITIVRFVDSAGLETRASRKAWVEKIEGLNSELREKYWRRNLGEGPSKAGQWMIGAERGLEVRKGRLWYGGGETVQYGKAVSTDVP
ncbi:uncharacterized protein JN550_009726 [Neoarthrinium moseri]|uniref:uncharacterized protein n=1 Tax=Neoarthrinium moseri TaxID=1658444 RepID=UPI001FDD5D9F|nr:uncharacterized protein JN550_009726 [Neoarthrinium moseri]KAI1863200.1 hypothetical protein JN550_009726 [Neoarthrinium moseri]